MFVHTALPDIVPLVPTECHRISGPKYRICTKKKFWSRERSVRMQLSHIAHVRIAYFTHRRSMILYAMAMERLELQ